METLQPRYYLSVGNTVVCMVATIAGYLVTFAVPYGAAAMMVALPAQCLLGRQRATWQALIIGLIVGFVICELLLAFFYSIFGPFSTVLWLVGALPFGVFPMLLCSAHRRLGPKWAMLLTPMLWTGIEYFRSEVWSLRFAWLLPGHSAAYLPGVRFITIGVYGVGFVYVLLSALAVGPSRRCRIAGAIGLALAAILMYVPPLPLTPAGAELRVAGVQTEGWDAATIADALDQLATSHPDAQILVLSELAFTESVPQNVREILKKHRRYLVAGGTSSTGDGDIYNTAFVVGPDGNDVFRQAKSMPVQFLNDGLPAKERRVWDSPWGKIGIAICYDACYASVMDEFVRQGARGLVIPTMDARSWGEFERRNLHGRVQPVRSAEYGVPTFGVWSSGVSQLTDRYGRVVATAGYPGRGETIEGSFDLSRVGRVPPDRHLAQAAVGGTAIFIAYVLYCCVRPASPNRAGLE